MSDTNRIARLRIELDNTKPVVWRTVEVPLTTNLSGLHEVINAAMPLEGPHLWDFQVGVNRYALPSSTSPDPKSRSPKAAKLGAVLQDGIRQFAYTYYVSGLKQQHTIKAEGIYEADPAVEYPRLLDAVRRVPLERTGSEADIAELLDVPPELEHGDENTPQRSADSVDQEPLDLEIIRGRMEKLARRRTLGKVGFIKSKGLASK
jgi:hypothetical protein